MFFSHDATSIAAVIPAMDKLDDCNSSDGAEGKQGDGSCFKNAMDSDGMEWTEMLWCESLRGHYFCAVAKLTRIKPNPNPMKVCMWANLDQS